MHHCSRKFFRQVSAICAASAVCFGMKGLLTLARSAPCAGASITAALVTMSAVDLCNLWEVRGNTADVF